MKIFKELISEFDDERRPRYQSPRDRKNSKDSGKLTPKQEQQLASKSSMNKKTSYRGWNIEPSTHASARAHQRRPEFSFDEWKSIHRNAVHHMEKNKPKEGYHMIFSKSKQQGYIAHVSPRKKKITVVTTLPKNKNHPGREGTGSMFVEDFDFEILSVIEVN